MRQLSSKHQSRFRRRARGTSAVLCALALLITLGAASESAAGAARFTYEVCDSALPGGGTPDVKLIRNPDSPFSGSNTCASPGGSLALVQSGSPSPTFAIWSVGIPATPGGYVEQLAVSAIACGLGAGNSNGHVYEVGWPANNCSESQRLFHIHDAPFPYAPGANLSMVLNCDGSRLSECATGATLGAHYFAATEVDPNAPSVSSLHGSLLAGGPIRGTQTLAAELTDKGGGLSEAAVLVNGAFAGKQRREPCSVISTRNPSVTGRVATNVSPCPAADSIEWTLDTQAYPFRDGANTVAVCGFDFATIGESNRGCAPAQAVSVDNSCTPSTVPGGELLSAEFTKSHESTYTAGFGEGAEISGRLATGAEDPVPGATLCVKVETLGVDERPATVATVTTDATGAYRYEVPAGPNRRFVLGYRNDSRQVARDVRFYSRVRPSLKLAPPVLRNGARVRLWGKLPGPRPGKRVVVLQANAPGSERWITFRRASTDASGAFHTGYRFNSTTQTIRYRFRALVPKQAGYPWVEGHSRPAAVTVKGGRR